MKRFFVSAFVAGALIVPGAAWAAGETSMVDVGVRGAGRSLERAGAHGGLVQQAAAATASGCRTVDVARVGRDIFGFVVYKFHVRKRWCWTYPRITSVAVSTYVSDVDPNMEYRGGVAAGGYYYTWCCVSSRSGHYSLRQGKVENCILWFPCTRTEYPWVKVWVRGNGSYRYSTGL